MADPTVKYKGEMGTVLWKPRACIHSGICFNGLPKVFRPRDKKWVHMDGASEDAIIEQVKKCPSGALSYDFNDTTKTETKKMENANVKITALPKGPLMVEGLVVISKDGKEESKEKVFLCRCGHSKNKPYCDGQHKQNEFEG